MKRAEFAALMVNALGLNKEAALVEEGRFKDLKGHWAAGAVEVLVVEGIVRGHADGDFHPDEVLLIEHAKIMVARALHLGEANSKHIDNVLKNGGVNPQLACSSDGTTLGQAVLLLDRAMSVPLYARYTPKAP